jgi:hypothetical protein
MPWVNIAIGLVCIGGAASGKMVLIGTHSSLALGVLGASSVAWGAYRLWNSRAR